MDKAIIVDIDGTIADLEHRLHYVKRPKKDKDYKSFFAEMHKDTPKKEVIDIIISLSKDYHIVFLTGRPEKCRSVTTWWLWNHIPESKYSFNWGMLMRPDDDSTPDAELKAQIYEEQIKKRFDVIAVFDDRQSVVDMWRKKGLICFQVDQWEEFHE